MKTSHTQLNGFYNTTNPEYIKFNDYEIIGREMVTKIISHPLPLVTGGGYYSNGFPKYLQGFENYYNHIQTRWTDRYELKEEYAENRPIYTYTVTYEEIDVEFTKKGKEKITKRIAFHKKGLAKYHRLLG